MVASWCVCTRTPTINELHIMYIMMSDVKNVERSRIPRASVFAGLRQEPCLHDVILATDDPNSFAMDFTSYRHQ
jgi:hypothetical protein